MIKKDGLLVHYKCDQCGWGDYVGVGENEPVECPQCERRKNRRAIDSFVLDYGFAMEAPPREYEFNPVTETTTALDWTIDPMEIDREWWRMAIGRSEGGE